VLFPKIDFWQKQQKKLEILETLEIFKNKPKCLVVSIFFSIFALEDTIEI
jgi:hypothetical protein